MGGGAGGRAGGRTAAAAAGISGAPGCRADAAASDPRRIRARPPEPRPRARSPEPRASAAAAAAAASRQPVPGHAAARKAAGAQQVSSAPLRPGKVSLASAGGSWRGVPPLPPEGRSSAPPCPPCVPPPRPRGHGDPRALPLGDCGARWGGVELRGSQGGLGEALEPSSTETKWGGGGEDVLAPLPAPSPPRPGGFPPGQVQHQPAPSALGG